MQNKEKKVVEYVKSFIREVPDFPKKGILFYDITPVLGDPKGFSMLIKHFKERYVNKKITKVVGIESRGFIFGGALADSLSAGFVPVRKRGKLPYKTVQKEYSLEYGTDVLEMHEDAITKDDRIILCDDLIATGGTAQAVAELIEQQGGKIIECAFVIELNFLKGRNKLLPREVHSILQY